MIVKKECALRGLKNPKHIHIIIKESDDFIKG
jgi:hypothetical protein